MYSFFKFIVDRIIINFFKKFFINFTNNYWKKFNQMLNENNNDLIVKSLLEYIVGPLMAIPYVIIEIVLAVVYIAIFVIALPFLIIGILMNALYFPVYNFYPNYKKEEFSNKYKSLYISNIIRYILKRINYNILFLYPIYRKDDMLKTEAYYQYEKNMISRDEYDDILYNKCNKPYFELFRVVALLIYLVPFCVIIVAINAVFIVSYAITLLLSIFPLVFELIF